MFTASAAGEAVIDPKLASAEHLRPGWQAARLRPAAVLRTK
jgi:hypothetical protein